MQLTEPQKAMLLGERGGAAALAMKLLVDYGRILDVPRMIPIQAAHIDGCLYHGQVSVDFAERLVRLGGHVEVPTTLNVSSLDRITPSHVRLPQTEWSQAVRLMDAYESLGCQSTWTCAPYQNSTRPKLGDQIAWAESNAIVFANSVLGARTNRYGDFIDICAAIAGHVPEAGLHLTENRRARWLFILQSDHSRYTSRDLLFPLLGYLVGSQCGFAVPAIDGLPLDATEDELKSLGATAASSGSVGMFHAIGITPEAKSIGQAFQQMSPERTIVLDDRALGTAFEQLNTLKDGSAITAVSLGTPHFSMHEFGRLEPLLRQRRKHPTIEFFVSTSRETLTALRANGMDETLRSFGAKVVVDTCTYITPILREGRGVGRVMTNSGKWAHYAPANLGVAVALGTVEECVESAVRGRVCRL